MSSDREPTAEERAAAARHHEQTCGYLLESECPLTDFDDPLDRYLPEDLEAIRGGS